LNFNIGIFCEPDPKNRKAKEIAKQEREKRSYLGRIMFDIMFYYRAFQARKRNEILPIWRKEIKFVELTYGGMYSAYFNFARYVFGFPSETPGP